MQISRRRVCERDRGRGHEHACLHNDASCYFTFRVNVHCSSSRTACRACIYLCVYYEWVRMTVCVCGNPVSLVSSFLSEIKVKWVIYHENMWLGHLSLPRSLCIYVCVCVFLCACANMQTNVTCVVQGQLFFFFFFASAAVCTLFVCACLRVCTWRPLVFARAMINGLHWAAQPCMFLGLSFYAVSN